MKAKQIIPVATVLIAVAVALYVFVLRPAEPFGKVPSGWSKVKDLELAEDALGATYRGTGTVEDAFKAFIAEMTKIGWTHVRDGVADGGFRFSVLEKDDYEATITAIELEPDIVAVSIIAVRSREEPPEEIVVPKQDIEGEDVEDLPRYPGSVRIRCESVPEGTAVEYLVSANFTVITDFYIDQLPANGWVLEGVIVKDQKTEIYATKANRGFVEIIIEKSDVGNDYMTVEAVFIPWE